MAVIPAMNGCSGTNNTPTGSDGGTTGTTDAGHDGGMTTGTDAGVSLHGIGTKCTDSSMQAQSNCDRGLVCIGLVGGENMCTKQGCSSDTDCGTTGGIQNVCTGGTDAFCLRGCDPAASNACGRMDFACISDTQNGVNFCIPDCRVSDYCGYPESCNMQTGDCSGSPQCSTNADCMNGGICVADPNQTGLKVCVKDCTQAGNDCPAGFMCNMTKKSCDPVPRNYYDACGTGEGQCVTNEVCVGFSASGAPGTAICLQNCKMDSDCPSTPGASACAVQLNGGTTVCGVTCDPQAATDTCPTGTQCLYQGMNAAGAMVAFCGPPQ